MKIEKINGDRQIEFILKSGDDFVGRIYLMAPLHLEGVELDQKWRSSIAFKKLVDAAETEAKGMGLTHVLAFGKDSTMEDYIQRLGYERLSLSVWRKELCR
jgi:N-acetylglutamate synthase-like GNAT family acetyltransferase